MKQIIFLLLFFSCHDVLSQDSDTKRPSWSQGMPERSYTPIIKAPHSSSELKAKEPSIDRSAMNLETTKAYDFETSLQSFDPIIPAPKEQEYLETQLENVEVQVFKEEAEAEDLKLTGMAEDKVSKLAKKTENVMSVYQWGIVRMVPVQLPRSLAAKNSSVLLELSIDENGLVLEVNPVLDNTPESVMLHVNRYVKQWRFDAPKTVGINQSLSRVFKVSLQARG